MPRTVKCALYQARNENDKDFMVEKHCRAAARAAEQGVQIVCFQELFWGPYFCAEQDAKWYATAEPVPGPTTERLQALARDHGVAIIAPMYEVEMPGIYYNTSAVIDADGSYLGKYRKNHIPHLPGFWEKFYFKPGNLGYPVFATRYARVGVYICYDRHFPEGARLLGLNGAEIVFNPSATVAGLSEHLWSVEQRAHAIANGYFVGALNRVGVEEPWKAGEFYGSSYFCDPRGDVLARGSRDSEELVVAELDLEMITDVRNKWQFYRDRRPETYGGLAYEHGNVADYQPTDTGLNNGEAYMP